MQRLKIISIYFLVTYLTFVHCEIRPLKRFSAYERSGQAAVGQSLVGPNKGALLEEKIHDKIPVEPQIKEDVLIKEKPLLIEEPLLKPDIGEPDINPDKPLEPIIPGQIPVEPVKVPVEPVKIPVEPVKIPEPIPQKPVLIPKKPFIVRKPLVPLRPYPGIRPCPCKSLIFASLRPAYDPFLGPPPPPPFLKRPRYSSFFSWLPGRRPRPPFQKPLPPLPPPPIQKEIGNLGPQRPLDIKVPIETILPAKRPFDEKGQLPLPPLPPPPQQPLLPPLGDKGIPPQQPLDFGGKGLEKEPLLPLGQDKILNPSGKFVQGQLPFNPPPSKIL